MPAHYTQCAPEMISTCSESHLWSSSVSHCPLYTLPVVKDGQTYRNPHCAACNGHNINQTQCSPGRRYSLWLWNHSVLSLGLTPSRSVWRGSLFHRLLVPTFSYLLDFSAEPSCDGDQFYEPLYRRCYSLQCSLSRTVNIAGSCLR